MNHVITRILIIGYVSLLHRKYENIILSIRNRRGYELCQKVELSGYFTELHNLTARICPRTNCLVGIQFKSIGKFLSDLPEYCLFYSQLMLDQIFLLGSIITYPGTDCLNQISASWKPHVGKHFDIPENILI